VREVINAVERITALSVPTIIGERREGDPAVLVGNASKARSELGWIQRFPELEEIVRSAWAWHQRVRGI
jgi:UDP-glucose 4-epimerase